VLLVVGVRAGNARLEPDAAGWVEAAKSFHERAALEKELDRDRRSPALLSPVVSGNAATGYVRALQLVPEQANPPWLVRNQQALARLRPGRPDPDAARDRAYLDLTRAAIAALVSAAHCESCSWGVDFESDPDHAALPYARARLFSSAAPLGFGCVAVSREKALAGDWDGALEHALAAARWAIDECPTVVWHSVMVSRQSAEQLGWLATRAPPGWFLEHAGRIRAALDALDARVPSAVERVSRDRFEHERGMLVVSEGMERDCERVPLFGSFFKDYSAPIARAFASQDAAFNRKRELYLEAERAAAIPDPEERRRALLAVDERWPRAKPEDEPAGYFASFDATTRSEHARLALAKATVEIEEQFEREGRAPAGWPLAQDATTERWIYQPRDDGKGWRIVTLPRFLEIPESSFNPAAVNPVVLVLSER